MRLSPRQRKWSLILAELLVFLVLYLGLRAYMQRDMADGPAPPLAGTSLTGEPLSLEDYRGRPVLVHFWASWCSVCRLEQDGVQAVAADWPVLSVALQSGSAAEVRAYLQEHGLTWDTLNDPDGSLARRFGVYGVPASFIVDADGRIRFHERGYTSSWGLRARLWLAGR